MAKRKYTYDRTGIAVYVIDEYGAGYDIGPDGSWYRDYERDIAPEVAAANARINKKKVPNDPL